MGQYLPKTAKIYLPLKYLPLKYLPKTAPFGAAVGSARQFAQSDENDRTPAVS